MTIKKCLQIDEEKIHEIENLVGKNKVNEFIETSISEKLEWEQKLGAARYEKK